MKKTVFVLCFMACTVVTGFAQERAIKKLIDEAITFQNMKIEYRNGTKEIGRLRYSVPDCRFEEVKLRQFMSQHPEYIITLEEVEREYRWGDYDETIVAFSFVYSDPAFNTLCFALRLANNDKDLQMPSYHNIGESSDFYQRYVKRFSELSDIFKSQFFPEFTSYVINNPEGMKRFCDGSPYSNKELLKDVDVWKLLAKSRKAQYAYVYLLEANNGFIFDTRGRYHGEIRNSLAEGQGTLYNDKGKWVGTFKSGKMNGVVTNTQKSSKYGSYLASYRGGFTIEYKGICVEDQWDDEVVKTVTTSGVESPYRPIYCNNSDVEKLYYSKGKFIKSTTMSTSLSDYLNKEMKNQEELARQWDLTWQAKQEAEKLRQSQVNINNVMNEVESIEQYSENSNWTTYEVKFKDGKSGLIEYYKTKGEWGGEDGYDILFFPYFNYPHPNSRAAAILILYQYVHKH